MKCDGCVYWVDAVTFYRGAFRRFKACHYESGCIKEEEPRPKKMVLSGRGALERYKELCSQHEVSVVRHERPCHSNGWKRTIEVDLERGNLRNDVSEWSSSSADA